MKSDEKYWLKVGPLPFRGPPHILPTARIHTHRFTSSHKQRHPNHRPGFQPCRLSAATGCAVSMGGGAPGGGDDPRINVKP